MRKIKLIQHSIPVFASNDETGFELDRLMGTSFSIGNGYLMTCKHVLEQAIEYKIIGITNFNKNGINGEAVHLHYIKTNDLILGDNYEFFEEYDLAIFKIQDIEIESFKWYGNELFTFENVMTYGYPFSYDIVNKYVNPRGLKGHIVSMPPFYQHVKTIDVYELSFACPRGISGAFLLNENMEVCGVIIGNSKTEIELYNIKEVSSDGNKIETYITNETTKFGISIRSIDILNLYSKLLKMKISVYLKSQKLIE